MTMPTVEQYQGFEQALYDIQANQQELEGSLKPALEFSANLEALYKQQLDIVAAEAQNTVGKYTKPGDDGKTYLDHLAGNMGMLIEFERSVADALGRRDGLGDYALIREYNSKKGLISQLKDFYRSQIEEYQRASALYAYILQKQYEEVMKKWLT